MKQRRTRIVFLRVALPIILIAAFSVLNLPFLKLYIPAKFGSSQAMYDLSLEYASSSRRVVSPNPFKHDYWLRESAKRGNLCALTLMGNSWEYSNPYELVYWLKNGCDLGIPWCAEQMAQAYHAGRFALGRDFVKSREYDDLSVVLHRKDGTLKDHDCLFLPGTSRGVSRDSPFSPYMQREVHPGILRESIPKK